MSTADTVSAFAAVAAFFLSLASFAYTNHVAEKLRRSNHRYNEWLTIRSDLERKLENFENHASGLVDLGFSSDNLETKKTEFRNQYRDLTKGQLLLAISLQNVGKVTFLCEKTDWGNLAYFPTQAENTNMDQIGELANALHISASHEDCQAYCKNILSICLRTSEEIRSAMRRQNDLFDPNYHSNI